MDKQQKQKFKKERGGMLNEELQKLNQTIEYIEKRHEEKIRDLREKIELLIFQKELLDKYNP